MSNRKRRLGRALSDMGVHTLLADIDTPNNDQIHSLAITSIQANANQPRKTFQQASLIELSESIKSHGVIQPIVVTEKAPNQYEIIAGERRYRASQMAGLTHIPAVIKNTDELTQESLAIIENIQREDLNAIDQAEAYARLIDVYQLSHEDIAKRVNKSRSAITNTLRLNKLHPEAKTLLQNGSIEMGHARAILSAEYELQPKIAQRAANQSLSVRQVEQLVKDKPKKAQPGVVTSWIVSKLKAHHINASVRGSAEKGSITLKYTSKDKLNQILAALTDEQITENA